LLARIGSDTLPYRQAGSRHVARDAEAGEIAASRKITAVHMDRRIRKSCAFEERIRATAASLIAAKPA
jgi:acyl-CoA thioesterase FadM